MKIEIKSWMSDKVLFHGEYETLSGADLSGADLSRAYLSGADMSGADLSGADLSGANLSSADLFGADLSRANLSGANLSSANLSGANLSGANLSSADLFGADLSGAYLSRANLSGANLSGADLFGADLSRAYLSGADMSGANLSSANLSGANIDDKYCFLSISPIGSENGCLWVMRDDDGVLKYNRGCFCGTEDEFVAAVNRKHAGTEYEKKYLAAVEFIKSQLADKLARPAPVANSGARKQEYGGACHDPATPAGVPETQIDKE